MRGVPRLRCGDRARAVRLDRDVEHARAALDDALQLGRLVVREVVHDAEPVAQRRRQHAGARRRADEREALERQLQRLRVRAAVDDEVDLEVLHRRIEILFDHRAEAVDLVDEQHVAGFERGQDADQVLRLLERRARTWGAACRRSRARSGSPASSCPARAARRTARARAARRAAPPRRSRCAGCRRSAPARRSPRTCAAAASRRRPRPRATRPRRRRALASSGCVARRDGSDRRSSCAPSRSLMRVRPRRVALPVDLARAASRRRRTCGARSSVSAIIASASVRLYASCSSTASASPANSGIGGASGTARCRRVLDQQEARDLPLQLGDDVARLLLADARAGS